MPDHARLADLLMSSSPGVAGGDRDMEIFCDCGGKKNGPLEGPTRPPKVGPRLAFLVVWSFLKISFVVYY